MDPNIPPEFQKSVVWQAINFLFDSSSDEEESSFTRRRRTRRKSNIDRNREEGHVRLFNDYFYDNAVYAEEHFRRRFRMHKHVFLKVVDAVSGHDEYFLQKPDATGKLGHSSLQKCTSAIRMLAYGASADSLDEYVRMAESTSIECLDRFTRAVINVFGCAYLRRPNNDDIERLLKIGEDRGFPGMLGSIDCMHWEWKNCPVAWKGQFSRGDHGKPTVMLEAVASADLWIWHAFFGVAGSNNDINVLNRSNVFSDVLSGQSPKVNFSVNGTLYNLGYYLAGGIYPPWAAFVKSISLPQGAKRELFKKNKKALERISNGHLEYCNNDLQ